MEPPLTVWVRLAQSESGKWGGHGGQSWNGTEEKEVRNWHGTEPLGVCG